MKKKIISFTLRMLLMAVFYFLAYEFWLDRSMEDTIQVIVTSIVAVMLMRAWEYFKRKRAVAKKKEEGEG